jgi:hypothetical protein
MVRGEEELVNVRCVHDACVDLEESRDLDSASLSVWEELRAGSFPHMILTL